MYSILWWYVCILQSVFCCYYWPFLSYEQTSYFHVCACFYYKFHMWKTVDSVYLSLAWSQSLLMNSLLLSIYHVFLIHLSSALNWWTINKSIAVNHKYRSLCSVMTWFFGIHNRKCYWKSRFDFYFKALVCFYNSILISTIAGFVYTLTSIT